MTLEHTLAELRRRGELWEPAPGLVAFSGDLLALRCAVEHAIACLARDETRAEWRVASAIPLETLARADYFASFPQWLTLAAHLRGDEAELARVAESADPAATAACCTAPASAALSPAVCYHVYSRLAARTLERTEVVTAQGTCFRHEGARHAVLERGWEFAMREIVAVGTEDDCIALAERGTARATALAERLGLAFTVEQASDPFFAPTARGRMLLQQVKALKHELLLELEPGRSIAAASFNRHETFFGHAFDIRLADATHAHSACVAFGIERWVLAIVARHGPDADSWPLDVRAGNGEWGMGNGDCSFGVGRSASGGVGGPLERRFHSPFPIPHSRYARHATAAERGAWSVERDIAWTSVSPTLAHRTPDVLRSIRDAAIIEAYHPVNLARLMRHTWDDVDAGVVFSLEAYEGFKHFHSLRTYLDAVGWEPRITDEEIVASRAAQAHEDIRDDELVEHLVEFMLSEHLAAYFFRRLGERAEEPVLKHLLGLIAADEVRHAQSASDLIAKRIERDREAVVPQVFEAASRFRHFGGDVVPDIPVAMPGDEIAIRTFARRIERLCGERLVDWLKTRI